MTVTLELKADEVQALQEMAQAAEMTVEAVLHALIAQVPLSRRAEDGGAEAPAAITAEAVTETAEAVAERLREQEEIEANIRRWREERSAL